MRYLPPLPSNILACMSPEDRAPLGKAGKTYEEITAKRASESERELQDNISNLLRLRSIWFFRQRMDKRTTGTLATPDYLFAVNGKACAFEVKLPGNEPTSEQLECHEAMRANGWNVRVITSERECVDALNELRVL